MFEYASSGNVEGLRKVVSDENLDAKDENGNSPLMLACIHGHYEAAHFLLQLSADPESKDSSGNTVLMATAFKGNVKIVKLLLRYGADPLAINDKNQTAVYEVVSQVSQK